MSAEEKVPFTHRAIITICSNGPEPEVNITVAFDPDQEGKTIEQLGYLPACFELVQDYIVPAINRAYMDWAMNPLLQMESPSDYDN